MNAIDTLRHLAAIANSRVESLPLGEARSNLQWFAHSAESLANAVERGVVSPERFAAEIVKLNDIDALPEWAGELAI